MNHSREFPGIILSILATIKITDILNKELNGTNSQNSASRFSKRRSGSENRKGHSNGGHRTIA
jgi:hypothetical protein